MEQVRQLSNEKEQLKNTIQEQEKANYELQSNAIPILVCQTHTFFYLEQRESLEEENRQVHNTNNSTITRLQELESTGSQLQVNQRQFLRS